MSTAANQADVVYFNMGRSWTIALNTLVEVTRQKVFYFLIMFALLMIASASFFSMFAFGEEAEYITQLKFIKDTGLGAIGVFGAIIAIVATAQLLPAELENRTIYTILAKPVHRSEFLLGKYIGAALLLLVSVVFMGALFLGVVFFKHQTLAAAVYQDTVSAAEQVAAAQPDITPRGKEKLIADARGRATQAVAAIAKTAGYEEIVKALVCIFCKLLLVAAFTLMISTFATSMVFSVVVSVMIFFACHLEPTAARYYGRSEAPAVKLMSAVMTYVIPNFAAFDVADDLFLGHPLAWLKVLKIVSYGAFYLLVALTLAYLFFREREI